MKNSKIITGQTIDSRKLKRAKELRQDMTPEERIIWNCLRRDQQGLHFRRQQIIDGWIVDFYCHSAGLVIEVDGGVHAEQKEYDQDRDHILAERGLRILRFPNEAVHTDLEGVLEKIRQVCSLLPSLSGKGGREG
jgi:very-short-patch-repair endonuclease